MFYLKAVIKSSLNMAYCGDEKGKKKVIEIINKFLFSDGLFSIFEN